MQPKRKTPTPPRISSIATTDSSTFHIIKVIYSYHLSCSFLQSFIIDHPKVNFQNEGKGRCILVLIMDCITWPAKNKILYLSNHVFVAPADPVPEGTVTGEVSGAATSTHESGHSTGVRSARKRKPVKRGTYNSLTRLCRGFCSKSYNVHHTCASHAPWIIQPDLQKNKISSLII